MDLTLQILGLTLGLIYLYFEYNADKRMFIVGIVMPMVSMAVYYRRGIYADFSLSIYYLLMAVYSYMVWTGLLSPKEKRGKPLPIRHLPLRYVAPLLVALVLIWGSIAAFLVCFTDSTVPYVDAFTTALSIVTTWVLSRKYIEQWIGWILVDVISVGLYLYKDIYPYALLYVVYVVVACLGIRKWRKLMAGQG